MNIENLVRFLFVCIIASGLIAGCGEKEPPSDASKKPPLPIVDGKPQEESPAQKYGRLYTKLLKQKELKEGLEVNIVAETKKKVAAFRQASPERRKQLLEGLEADVKKYKADR